MAGSTNQSIKISSKVDSLSNNASYSKVTDTSRSNSFSQPEFSEVEDYSFDEDSIVDETVPIDENSLGYDDLDPDIQKLLDLYNFVPEDVEKVTIDGNEVRIYTPYFYEYELVFDSDKKMLVDVLDKKGRSIYVDVGMFTDEANERFLYGGDQASLVNHLGRYLNDETIKSIINKYYPDDTYTENDLIVLFAKMNNVGCGYVGGANTIISGTTNLTDDEFFDAFGFKRDAVFLGSIEDESSETGKRAEYRKTFNYDYMFLDYFLYYQKNYRGFDSLKDIYEGSTYDTEGLKLDLEHGADGTDVTDEMVVLKDYLKSKLGITISTEEIVYKEDSGNILKDFAQAVDAAYNPFREEYVLQIKKALEEGKMVLIAAYDFSLYYTYDVDGNGKMDDVYGSDYGSHGMIVTGITDEGDLIVSSWGKEFVYKPEFESIYNLVASIWKDDSNVLFSAIIIDYPDTDFTPKYMPEDPIPVELSRVQQDM